MTSRQASAGFRLGRYQPTLTINSYYYCDDDGDYVVVVVVVVILKPFGGHWRLLTRRNQMKIDKNLSNPAGGRR